MKSIMFLNVMIMTLVALLTPVKPTMVPSSHGYASYFPYYSTQVVNRGSLPPVYPASANPQSLIDEGSLQGRGFSVISLMLLSQLTSRLTELEETIKNLSNTNGQGTTDELESIKLKLTKIESSQTNLEGNLTVTKNEMSTFKLNLTALEGNLTATNNEMSTIKSNMTALEGTVNTTTFELAATKFNLTLLEGTVNRTTFELATTQLNVTLLEGTVNATRFELAVTKLNVTYLEGNLTGLSEPTSIDGMPKSCGDLQTLGNTKSGFYNVMNATKIAVVYCDFIKKTDNPGYELYIGYQDVKNVPVYFCFQKNQDSDRSGEIIPFEVEVLNNGGAMDKSGVFTAPVSGTYFFAFTGAVSFGAEESFVKSFSVLLLMEGSQLGFAKVEEKNFGDHQIDTVHLEMTLKLSPGQKVHLEALVDYRTYLVGSSYTQFTGILLEEDSFPV